MNKLTQTVKRIVAVVKDVRANPTKYRKSLAVPAAVVVYAVSTQLGADSKTTLEVVAVLTELGVYAVPNKA